MKKFFGRKIINRLLFESLKINQTKNENQSIFRNLYCLSVFGILIKSQKKNENEIFFFNRFQQIFYYHHHHSKKKLKKFFKHTHTYIVTGVMITIWHMMTDDDTQLITPITIFLVTFRYMARNVNIQNIHNMRHTSTHAIYKKKVFSISGSSSNNHAFIGRY